MADSRTPFAANDLEAALTDLGARIAYPPDAAIAAAVTRRLLAEPASRRLRVVGAGRARPGRTVWRAALLAAALLLVLAGVAVAAGFGIRGVQIIFSRTPPSVAPAPTPTASGPAPLGASFGLGDRVSIEEADRSLEGSYAVARPRFPSFGSPDEVYLDWSVSGGQAALVYGPRPGVPADPRSGVGALLFEFQGRLVHGPLLTKVIGPGTTVEHVTVDGAPAIWISGAPHEVFLRDRDGRIRANTVRLAGNVLLWERGGLTLRLEAAVGRAEAIRIASSVR